MALLPVKGLKDVYRACHFYIIKAAHDRYHHNEN